MQNQFLTAQDIIGHLPPSLRGIPITVLESTDSTNTRLRAMAADGCENMTLLCAERQTGGRGRHGRSFASPQGGVYMSLYLREYPTSLPLTVYAAVALRRALDPLTGGKARIKWVNDIFVGRLKVAGILAEAIPGGAIIGIGVNLHSDGLPSELEGIAGAIGTDAPRCAVIAAVTAELDAVLRLGHDTVIEEYRRFSMLIGREVRFERGSVNGGTVVGISDSGGLLAKCENGVIELTSGEVSFRF